MKVAVLTVFLLILLTVTCWAAENLVANPTFNSHVAYWDLRFNDPADSLDWDSEDSNGDPSSGSMEVTEGDGSGSLYSAQCIPVLGGNDYQFAGEMKIVNGAQSAKILLQQFEGFTCDTGFISNFSAITIAVGQWIPVDQSASLDAAANSVLLGGWLYNESGGAATAKYDDFSLSSEEVIFFDHFEYGDLLRWDSWQQ